jgi:hypothetical protein
MNGYQLLPGFAELKQLHLEVPYQGTLQHVAVMIHRTATLDQAHLPATQLALTATTFMHHMRW